MIIKYLAAKFIKLHFCINYLIVRFLTVLYTDLNHSGPPSGEWIRRAIILSEANHPVFFMFCVGVYLIVSYISCCSGTKEKISVLVSCFSFSPVVR